VAIGLGVDIFAQKCRDVLWNVSTTVMRMNAKLNIKKLKYQKT